jgi:ATP-dependent DNA ligase
VTLALIRYGYVIRICRLDTLPYGQVHTSSRSSTREIFKFMALRTAPALPRIQPIVPVLHGQAFNNPGWLFEPKYDGFRGIVYLTGRRCTIYSKRGHSFSRFDELRERLCAELPRLEVILDGELIAIDDEGRMNFWDLMKGRGHLAFAAFDILWLRGKDLRQLPLIERKKRLKRLLPEAVGPLNLIPWFDECGRELFQAARQYDLEGIVAKRKADPMRSIPVGSRSRTPRIVRRKADASCLTDGAVERLANRPQGPKCGTRVRCRPHLHGHN